MKIHKRRFLLTICLTCMGALLSYFSWGSVSRWPAKKRIPSRDTRPLPGIPLPTSYSIVKVSPKRKTPKKPQSPGLQLNPFAASPHVFSPGEGVYTTIVRAKSVKKVSPPKKSPELDPTINPFAAGKKRKSRRHKGRRSGQRKIRRVR